jgi:uncharacterized protein
MRITLDRPTSSNSISAYRPGVVTIAGTDYRRSLIVSADRIVEGWDVPSIASLNRARLDEGLALSPEILLLGTGRRLQFPEPTLYAAVAAMGIGLEVMDTAAACRTFNILLSEDRPVVAALVLDEAPAG